MFQINIGSYIRTLFQNGSIENIVNCLLKISFIMGLRFQLELRITLALVERLAFPFERGDTFFQFRLVQKVGIAG